MLSFEEFFYKKKIDLTALQAGEPALYAEFSKHYAAMGEKSFDHTKKFWFNKLRKSYLIAAGEPAPIPEKPLSTSDTPVKPVSQVMPVEPTVSTPKPAGFKPRFKAGATKAVAESADPTAKAPSEEKTAESKPLVEAKSVADEQAQPVSKPAGFKPRFKAGATKAVVESADPTAKAPSEEKTAESKPLVEAKSVADEQAQPISKPAGFKPRFKAGVTKAVDTKPAKPEDVQRDPVSSAESTKDNESTGAETKTILAEKEENSNPQIEEDKPVSEEKTPTTSKPAGFKPRFKAGVTKPSKPKDDQ